MSASKTPDQRFELSERSQMLFEKLADIDQLDSLINLACSVLNASLYLSDAQGRILASSPSEGVRCKFWTQIIESGWVEKKILNLLQVPRAFYNTMKEEQCGDLICARLVFPLQLGGNVRPGATCFFFWNHDMSYEDQCIASILAGAFSSLMQRQSHMATSPQEKQTRVLHELLDFKAGLKSYYLRSIIQTGLQEFTAPFRVVTIPLSSLQQQKSNLLALELSHRLPDAWCFAHGSSLLVIFNEELMTVSSLREALIPYLSQQHMTASLSMPFYDLLRLRFMFEDCQSILPIAMQKEPETRIHMAEHYQCTAFLARCQQYFPLQDYYPEGLTRLMEYDQENNRNYLATLTAYLENNMNANAAAKSIFMHRNTMMQQIEKIEQIMGVSLEDKEICLYLQICLRIHELLNL